MYLNLVSNQTMQRSSITIALHTTRYAHHTNNNRSPVLYRNEGGLDSESLDSEALGVLRPIETVSRFTESTMDT